MAEVNNNDSNATLPVRILETCLSVTDMKRARDFYIKLFGFPVMVSDDRLCAFRAGDKEVLILFLRGSDPKGTWLTFGWLPPHGTTGSSHIGFAIPENSLTSWKAKLNELKIPIESELTWPEGGTSVYFRDPDNHLLELITPGVWDNY